MLLYVDGPGPLDEPVARFLPLAITGAVLMNCLVYAIFSEFCKCVLGLDSRSCDWCVRGYMHR